MATAGEMGTASRRVYTGAQPCGCIACRVMNRSGIERIISLDGSSTECAAACLDANRLA